MMTYELPFEIDENITACAAEDIYEVFDSINEALEDVSTTTDRNYKYRRIRKVPTKKTPCRKPSGNIELDRRYVRMYRCGSANALLNTIADHGRNFFRHGDSVAYLKLDHRGRVWFHDHYTEAQIYTHYDGHWRGFTGGGGLKNIIVGLRKFIVSGKKLSGLGSKHWDYPEADLEAVQEHARILGILEGDPV